MSEFEVRVDVLPNPRSSQAHVLTPHLSHLPQRHCQLHQVPLERVSRSWWHSRLLRDKGELVDGMGVSRDVDGLCLLSQDQLKVTYGEQMAENEKLQQQLAAME